MWRDFVRSQIDNCMRIFAAFIAESQTDFIDGFFVGKKISDMKDNRGNKMKDYILRQRLAEYDAKLDLVYRNFSEYVHLAEKAFYSSVTTSSSEQYLKPSDVLHIPGLGFDGLVGYSPIAMAKNAIGMAIACEEYGAKFFANGATPGGILEDPGTVKDPQRGRDSWTSAFGGSSNFNKVAVLEEGMKYTPISISPEQAQFLETRKFQINEIARSKQKSGWLHGRS